MPAKPPHIFGFGGVGFGLQTPRQSAPPFCGSHPSFGISTQAYPLGQTKPAKPPQYFLPFFSSSCDSAGVGSLPSSSSDAFEQATSDAAANPNAKRVPSFMI